MIALAAAYYVLTNLQYIVCSIPYDEITSHEILFNECEIGVRARGQMRYGPYILSGVQDGNGLVLIDPTNQDRVKYLEN